MKKTLLLLFLLAAFTSIQAQEKGATQIFVKNNLSAKENHRLVIKSLIDNDYYIENQDSTIGYVKTQPRKLGRLDGDYILNIVSKDSEIKISGMMKSNLEVTIYGVTSKSSFEPITMKGGKKSFYMEGFNLMKNFSLMLGNNIDYK